MKIFPVSLRPAACVGVLGEACTHLVWKGPQKGVYCLVYTLLTLLSSLVLKAQAQGRGGRQRGWRERKEGGREEKEKERKEEEKGEGKEWKEPV